MDNETKDQLKQAGIVWLAFSGFAVVIALLEGGLPLVFSENTDGSPGTPEEL